MESDHAKTRKGMAFLVIAMAIAATITLGTAYKTNPNGSCIVQGKLSYEENLGYFAVTSIFASFAVALCCAHYTFWPAMSIAVLALVAYSISIAQQWRYNEENVAIAYEFQGAVVATLLGVIVMILGSRVASVNVPEYKGILALLVVPFLVLTLYDSVSSIVMVNHPPKNQCIF